MSENFSSLQLRYTSFTNDPAKYLNEIPKLLVDSKTSEWHPEKSSLYKKASGCGNQNETIGGANRRFWSMFPLTRVPFWHGFFEPQPSEILEDGSISSTWIASCDRFCPSALRQKPIATVTERSDRNLAIPRQVFVHVHIPRVPWVSFFFAPKLDAHCG